jgi:hypothetical protein
MVLAVWPEEFNPPIRNSFALSEGEGRLRTQAESGPVRQRSKFSSVSQPVSLTFSFTRNELARFDRFYFDEIARGALPFLMPDFSANGFPLMSIDGEMLTDDEDNVLTITSYWLVQLGQELPERRNIGVRWQVSFTLDVMP